MGSGASVHESLPSLASVTAAHTNDRYTRARQQDEEFLAREHWLSSVHGFDSTAEHLQPLMKDKLERSLRSLDDLGVSFGEDQQRCRGYTEVPTMALTSGGCVQHFCVLNPTTIACASDKGPVWVFNWREGCVVSRMRDAAATEGTNTHFEGRVSRMCSPDPNRSLLATGDENGALALWDLRGPALDFSVRLHESRITGLQGEWDSRRLITTSPDTYIILYDMQQRQVLERGAPASATCGSGVPNTILTAGGERQRHLLFVGGADGKLRIWTKDQGPLRREHSLNCGAAHPTQCQLAGDGYQVLVSTAPADPAFCAGQRDRGGLLLFDLRRLGGQPGSALLAKLDGVASLGAEQLDDEFDYGPASRGVEDMCLVEEEGESIVYCLAGGLVRAYDLRIDEGVLAHRFDFDVLAQGDGSAVRSWHAPSALAASGRLVFTATNAPSLGIWYRQSVDESIGHSNYVRQVTQPLALRARFISMPLAQSSVTGPRTLSAMEKLEHSLAADQKRLGGLPQLQAPFEPFHRTDGTTYHFRSWGT